MIGDIVFLTLTKTDESIMRMRTIDIDKYQEIWSFWGMEAAKQEIEGRERLRYHLGHLLITKYLTEISNCNKKVRPVLLDYKGEDGAKVSWSEKDVKTTKDFLSIFLGKTIRPESYRSYFERVINHSDSKELYNNICSQTQQLIEPIQEKYHSLHHSDKTWYYLSKYRDMNIIDFQYIPKNLRDIYESFEYRSIISPHIFFASLFALHISNNSETQFINGFWVKKGFPFLACLQTVENKKICIIEGKRSAYIWLFMSYLRIMYEHKNECKINFPDIGYIDSLPSINGAPFMQLNDPSEALFLDSYESEIKRKLMQTSKLLGWNTH